MGIAIVALLILVVVALIGIPILMRVFGEATRRNPDRPSDEEEENSRDGDSGRE